ncbi:hypothetical protein E3T28_11890 [Cryobacterium sinapicolor]|uniref:DUF1304 domain-containing protein n=1 Tax=Cryobacterium sinapicolor TaxID=1259236 RepID=A0ABY2IYW3_9MICO|nr:MULTISPECIES: DUF6463 family protein [Cryobacterium]TFC93253.1 hypothetical protein E3O67_02325 [Cryobacterium sp. TMT3-29-2]TFC97716.1 hypothetical protein E3T28_11890 [Cryobacterium sinapicolor]
MSTIAAWILFFLGLAHIAFGIVKFRKHIAHAISGGFINKFKETEAYGAFWFLMSGPPLMLSGQIAVHAISVGDFYALKVIGIYTLVSAVIGVIAFPKSPFWGMVVLAPLLIAAGYGVQF